MTKAFWRRWISAGVSAVVALVILVYSLRKSSNSSDRLEVTALASLDNFAWISFLNSTSPSQCRNSVQGPRRLADEQGYVCDYDEAVSNRGCCRHGGQTTKRFSCFNCKKNRCCEDFENCVSCCLRPQHVALLRHVLEHVRLRHAKSFADIDDTFDLCLFICRTSSVSVQQENTYRDIGHRYCYGLDPPSLDK